MTEGKGEHPKITRTSILDNEWAKILRKEQINIIVDGYRETQEKIQLAQQNKKLKTDDKNPFTPKPN